MALEEVDNIQEPPQDDTGGLPILKKKSSKTTSDGLPILKKEGGESSYPTSKATPSVVPSTEKKVVEGLGSSNIPLPLQRKIPQLSEIINTTDLTVEKKQNKSEYFTLGESTQLPNPIGKSRSKIRRDEIKEKALDISTEKALKAKGIKTAKYSAVYNQEKLRLRKAIDNGDAQVVMREGEDGKKTEIAGVGRNTGFWESAGNALNQALHEEDKAMNFVYSDTKGKVDIANKELKQKENLGGYVSEQPSPILGKGGEMLGGATPFLTKATAATVAAIALETATFGGATPGLAPTMAFVLTAPDAIAGGEYRAVLERYSRIKEESPDISDEEAMQQAQSVAVPAAIISGVSNALMLKSGLKVISNEGKNVISKTIAQTLNSSVHLGNIEAGSTAANLGVGELQGFHTPSKEAIDKIVKHWSEGATVGGALHLMTASATGSISLPKTLKSAFKYVLAKETTPETVREILTDNERLGNIPEGTTEAVVKDLKQYSEALAKVPEQGLSEESISSIAGLLQAKENLIKESESKDESLHQPYKEKIEAINSQIQDIQRTNKPFEHEVDDVSGSTLAKPTFDDVAQKRVSDVASKISKGKEIEDIVDVKTQSQFPEQLEKELKKILRDEKSKNKDKENPNNEVSDNIEKYLKEKEDAKSAVVVTPPDNFPEPITPEKSTVVIPPDNFPEPITPKENVTISPTNETTTEKVSEPISENVGESKGQGDKEEVQAGVEGTRPTDAERAASIPPVEPPIPEPPKTESGAGSEGEDWVSIRKEKLKEIEGVKNLFEKRLSKTWGEVYDNALTNLQKMYHKKSLYDAMKSRVREFVVKLENKELYNPTSEDIAVFNVFRAETQKRINEIDGMESDNPITRQAALAEFNPLHEDLLDIAMVVNPEGESGRAFGMHQAEIKLDPNYGLKIRRMELMKAKDGEKLSPEDEKWTEEKWNQEKELMKQEEEIRSKAMQEEFDNKIADLQKDYEAKLKEAQKSTVPKTSKEKKLSQKGKDIADKIRKLKKPKGGTNIDFTLGTWDLAVEGIAQLVEKGATIAEAIETLVKDGKLGFKLQKDREEFEGRLADWVSNKKNKESELERIKEYAEENDVTDINDEMVLKNMVRDYIDSHIGEVDKDKLFEAAYKDLKEVLPNLSKSRLAEAYLKKGEFKQPTKKQLENSIRQQQVELKRIAKEELTADQEQKIKLDAEKEKAIKKEKEFKKKLENKEFEEPIPIKLKKADAELIRLKKKQSIIEEEYRKKQKAYQEKNKHWGERTADFARSMYVAGLIGSPTTLLKVATMSVLRPMSEAGSRLTFGKLFDVFFPGISKVALRGGEGSSVRGMEKGFQAYFRQFNEKQIEAKHDKAEKEYEAAVKEFSDYHGDPNWNQKTSDALKEKMNDKLMKVQGTIIYKFIGGSSIKDAIQALVHRSNEIEKQFGHVEGEGSSGDNALTQSDSPLQMGMKLVKQIGEGAKELATGYNKDSNKAGQAIGKVADKVNYLVGFIGRSHSAAKTFSGRFSFASAFMARLEGAVRNGENISSGDKILEIAHESYLDWERGKYQQSNQISDLWNKLVNHISKGEKGSGREGTAKAMEALLKGDVAITRVPVNILHEAVMEYTLGAFRAVKMAMKETSKAKGELKKEGIDVDSPEFKDALREKINQMDAKQAATIARCFRKGGLGVGLYAFALISASIQFGVFPHMGQKKKKEEAELEKNELNPGQVMIGNNKLGEATSAIIEHIPALWTTFMGLGLAHEYKDQIDKGKTTQQAAVKSLFTHLQVIEGGIPQTKVISPTRVVTNVKNIVKKREEELGITEKDTYFNKKEISEYPAIDVLKEKGIELKSLSQSSHKVDVDEKHPYGIMLADEWEKFNEKRKEIILHGIPEGKDDEHPLGIDGLTEILNSRYTIITYDKVKETEDEKNGVLGSNLPKEELQKKITELNNKATEIVGKEMGLKKEKPEVDVIKE